MLHAPALRTLKHSNYKLARWLFVHKEIPHGVPGAELLAFAMIAGGLGTFWKRMRRLMNQGTITNSSWLIYSLVGTEKTSAGPC